MAEKKIPNKAGNKISVDRDLLQSLIKTLPDLIWLKDTEGRFLMCNLRFEKLYGKKESEIIGKTDFDFVSADEAMFFRKKDKEALNANRSLTNIEWVTFADDGHREMVETIKTPLYDNNKNIVGVIGIARDITSRYFAEEALRDSEKKYKYLFASNPVPMWIYDIETLKFIEVNRSAINHYGYSRKKFLSMTIKDIRPHEDLERFLEDISAISNNTNSQGVRRHIKKSGEIIYADITSHLITLNRRKARLVLANDVTEKIMADQQINKLLRAIEHSPVSIMITDNKGKIEYVNPKFTSITGYTQGEVLGKDPSFLRSPTEVSEHYKTLWDTISSGKEWQGEFINVNKDGGTFIEHASISPVYDENHTITHYVAVKEDITQRKKDEESLRKFSLGIEESTDAMFITAIDGTIEYINPAFEKIYGFTKKEALGKTPRILKSGSITPEEYKIFWDTLLAGDEVKGEIKNKTKSGEIIDIEGSNSPIHDSSGKLIGFLSINRDITERKQAQAEILKAKEKAEEADKLKTAFLHNISHEIRTPMNSILGFSALMTEPDLPAETLSSYIESIQKSSDHLLSILVDIISVSEAMAKTAAIKTEKTNLNELLNRITNPYKSQAEDKNINFKLIPALPDRESEIITDKFKLAKIITNIVDNAIKFTDNGRISVGYKIKDQEVEFCVSDTGIGISPKYQSKIFENFFQVEHTLTRTNEGTGLGLSICKAFVELLGGRIWVESTPGAGSGFFFTVPYKNAVLTEEGKREKTDTTAHSATKATKILVAEDDMTNFFLINKLLDRFNMNILHAKNGIEAVNMFKANKDINIVLLDIKMPEIDGFQAAAQIKEIKPEVILIAQTAYVDDAEVALEAGFNDFIPKPFEKGKFISTIEKYIRQD